MANPPASDQLLVRYLLDQLSDEERTRVEDRFLSDEAYYEQLLVVEDELRCAYAAGALPPEDRRLFEARFLIFEDEREKVAVAKAMIAELSAPPAAGVRSVAPRLALAAAAIVAVTLVSWQAFDARRLRTHVAALEAERAQREQAVTTQSREERARREQLDRDLQQERRTRAALEQELATRAPAGTVLSLLLTPGRVRSGGTTQTITLSPAVTAVRLLLRVEGARAYRAYTVEILNANGDRVWSRGGIARGQQHVVLTVPASLFAEDDYEVALTGVTAGRDAEPAGRYYFTVLK